LARDRVERKEKALIIQLVETVLQDRTLLRDELDDRQGVFLNDDGRVERTVRLLRAVRHLRVLEIKRELFDEGAIERRSDLVGTDGGVGEVDREELGAIAAVLPDGEVGGLDVRAVGQFIEKERRGI